MKTRNIIAGLVGMVAISVAGIVAVSSLRSPQGRHAKSSATSAQRQPNPLNEPWLKRLDSARRFTAGDARSPENAQVSLSLALGNGPPRLIAAAIYALQTAYQARPAEAAQLSQAILAKLDSADDIVLGAALSAAKSLLEVGSEGASLDDRILGLAAEFAEGAGRYALLDTIGALPISRVQERHIVLARESLDDENAFVRSRA